MPGNPSRAIVRAFKDGYQQADGPIVQSATYHELINPYRAGGVADVLLNHRFVLLPPGPPNNAPVASDDTYIVAQNRSLAVAAPGLLANDVDADGDALIAVLGNAPTSGTVALEANGSFVYTPSSEFHGVDAFTYTTSDAVATSTAATVTITVTPATAVIGRISGEGHAVVGAGSDAHRYMWQFSVPCDGRGAASFGYQDHAGGARFQLTSASSVACTGDALDQARGRSLAADTLTLMGEGRWDGRQATVRVTLSELNSPGHGGRLEITISEDGVIVHSNTLSAIR